MLKRNFTTPEMTLILMSLAWLLLCLFFNLDLSHARYELFMDEQISFDGIMNIYHTSLDRLSWNLRDGGDYRYGRIFWNLLAFFSWPAWKIFGLSGLIVSNRMFSSLFQLSSYLLLLYTFIPKDKELYRPIGLAILILLPATLYFSHLPKPEPIQLLALSLFLASKFRWKKPLLSFFFLGIGLGAKISLLPGCLFILAWEFFSQRTKMAKKTLAFVGGCMVGAPILTYLSPRKILGYWNTIKVNALHGSDRSDVNWFSWLDFFINDYFSSTLTGMIVLITIGISIAFTIRHAIIKNLNRPSLYLLVLSMSFTLPIFLFVKRLWPMYLHIGLVLMTVAFLNIYSRSSHHKKLKATLAILVASFCLLRLEPTWAEIQRLAYRTLAPTYIAKKKLWETTQALTPSSGHNILCIDPNMFYEKTIGTTRIIPFWGPFNFNRYGFCNAIFMYDRHLDKEQTAGSREEEPHKIFLEQYKNRVNDPSLQTQCSKNCYKRLFHPNFSNVIFLLKE